MFANVVQCWSHNHRIADRRIFHTLAWLHRCISYMIHMEIVLWIIFSFFSVSYAFESMTSLHLNVMLVSTAAEWCQARQSLIGHPSFHHKTQGIENCAFIHLVQVTSWLLYGKLLPSPVPVLRCRQSRGCNPNLFSLKPNLSWILVWSQLWMASLPECYWPLFDSVQGFIWWGV